MCLWGYSQGHKWWGFLPDWQVPDPWCAHNTIILSGSSEAQLEEAHPLCPWKRICVALISFGIPLYCFLTTMVWVRLSFSSSDSLYPMRGLLPIFTLLCPKYLREQLEGRYIWSYNFGRFSLSYGEDIAWPGKCPDLREFLPKEERG